VIFIISWCIASVFMVVYETCIDTVCLAAALGLPPSSRPLSVIVRPGRP
jgi:hypothetical protein